MAKWVDKFDQTMHALNDEICAAEREFRPTIAIQDHDRKKAALWDALQAGELSRDDCELIDFALGHFAETRMRDATEMRRMDLPHAERVCKRIASRARDLQDKFTQGGNAYIMPGDA